MFTTDRYQQLHGRSLGYLPRLRPSLREMEALTKEKIIRRQVTRLEDSTATALDSFVNQATACDLRMHYSGLASSSCMATIEKPGLKWPGSLNDSDSPASS
jgi:hypothetical protein